MLKTKSFLFRNRHNLLIAKKSIKCFSTNYLNFVGSLNMFFYSILFYSVFLYSIWNVSKISRGIAWECLYVLATDPERMKAKATARDRQTAMPRILREVQDQGSLISKRGTICHKGRHPRAPEKYEKQYFNGLISFKIALVMKWQEIAVWNSFRRLTSLKCKMNIGVQRLDRGTGE